MKFKDALGEGMSSEYHTKKGLRHVARQGLNGADAKTMVLYGSLQLLEVGGIVVVCGMPVTRAHICGCGTHWAMC